MIDDMAVLLISLILTIIKIVLCEENCHHLGIALYEDLGCTPLFDEGKSCPAKYECNGLQKSDQYCNFGGKQFKLRENINGSGASCHEGCFCAQMGNRADIICAILDCPEWLGVPIPKNCYRKYTLEHCCSSATVCPPFKDSSCKVDGKILRDGELFTDDEHCKRCVCNRGELLCTTIKCGVQLRYAEYIENNCAPVYSKYSSCCPFNWICPNGLERVKGHAESEETCQFGNMLIKVGQTVRKHKTEHHIRVDIDCVCAIPPFLTCRRYDNNLY